MAKSKGKVETETTKHAGGRPSKYDAVFHPLLVESLARNGLINPQIAERMGIATSTLSKWMNDYPEFSDALKRGREEPDDKVENSLLKRALGYQYHEITKERIVDTGEKARHGGQSSLTEREWEDCKVFFGECCYCGSKKALTKDHVIPLNDGGTLSKGNIVPACQSCNSSKSDNNMESWYLSQQFYKKERLSKINAYLDSVNKEADQEAQLMVTKVVTKELAPDPTSMIFWLKNRRPDRWRDKQDINLSGMVETASLTPDERKARRAELEAKRSEK